MEIPVFRLGLVGFDDRDAALLRQCVARYSRAHWLCGTADGADAWLINGAQACFGQEGKVRVQASHAGKGGAPMLVDVRSRPTAFAAPPPQGAGQLFSNSFDLTAPDTVEQCLGAIDGLLAPLRRVYRVAARLIDSRPTVGKAVYELRAGPRILAVVGPKDSVFIAPDMGDDDLSQAIWNHRARRLVEVPAGFELHVLSEVLWTYTTRTRADLLPRHYRQDVIYLRRPPRVPASAIGDIHLRLIRELARAPSTLTDLQRIIDADPLTIERSVAALYYVGAVTSNLNRAWSGSERGGLSSARSSLHSPVVLGHGAVPQGPPSTTPLCSQVNSAEG